MQNKFKYFNNKSNGLIMEILKLLQIDLKQSGSDILPILYQIKIFLLILFFTGGINQMLQQQSQKYQQLLSQLAEEKVFLQKDSSCKNIRISFCQFSSCIAGNLCSSSEYLFSYFQDFLRNRVNSHLQI